MKSVDKALVQRWRDSWPGALKAWGAWTRLPEPFFAASSEDVERKRLHGVLAQFSMDSKGIQVNLEEVLKQGLHEFPLEILAHEVGHHVLAPGDLLTHFRLLAQVRKGLPTFEDRWGEVANLWTDILVNDRLYRNASLPMDRVYRAMGKSNGLVWGFYMRVYERLWDLEKGALFQGVHLDKSRMETFHADAWLGARTARIYGDDPVRGAGRFAALLLPWLIQEGEISESTQSVWMDARRAAEGATVPAGLGTGDGDPVIHPSQDPAVTGEEVGGARRKPSDEGGAGRPMGGQWREPWEFGELLKLGGLDIGETAAAAHYYRERALPHLVNPPRVVLPRRMDPLPEGLDPWDIGESVETLDIFQSVMQSPTLVPGVTTVSRHWGVEPGQETRIEPLDLDLYVDSSGSMPDPRRTLSYPALAGAIVALSTLRRGGAVQVTLWSGKGQCMRTKGFVRNEDEALEVLCSHFGGSTAFPIHALRKTWENPRPGRKAHILHISDDGLSTMFDMDELGNSGWTVGEQALANAGGGGTMVLHLPGNLSGHPSLDTLDKARDEQGWAMHKVQNQSDLLEFAIRFSQTHASREKPRP